MGVVIDTLSYPGSPTPGQDFLRITEILFAPAAPTESELAIDPTLTAEDFEFVELTNTGSTPLDISGASFVEGISLSFPPQTILAAGQHILVVANLTAFNLRYQGTDNVAGEYTGKLSNDGEQLQILDAEGENILEFSYNDAWYDATDDAGHSLVARNPATTPITDFDRPANWGVSLEQGGDPGISSSFFAVTFSSWKYQNFSEESVSDPTITGGSVDLDADTLNTVMEYGFGRNPTTSDAGNNYRASLVEYDGADYLALSFRRQKGALDLSYEVQFSSDLISWIPSEETVGEPRDNGDGTETVTIRDQIPASRNSTRYTRVRIAIGQ